MYFDFTKGKQGMVTRDYIIDEKEMKGSKTFQFPYSVSHNDQPSSTILEVA